MNNWLTFDLVFYNCGGVHEGLDAYEEGGICACERCQACKILFVCLLVFWPTTS